MAHLESLVVVAGHAVYVGHDFSPQRAEDNEAWFLEDYQRVPGQARTFVDHIRTGVEAAAADPLSLLLFSGGETRAEAGPRSEAGSYWGVADAAEWYGHAEVRTRALTEDGARDSYENLLFAVCRFYEVVGRYPARVTVVGYDFKRARFEEVHRAAIGFPRARFSYVGTPAAEAARAKATAAEERTLESWRTDPYGCGAALGGKRVSRDPFSRAYKVNVDECPAMAELMVFCGPGYFQQRLPWDEPWDATA